MNILSVLGGIASKFLPSLNKQKAQSKAIDSLLSKRGETTKGEVLMALGYKYIRLFVYCYVIWAIINDKVSFSELVKILIQ